MIYLYVKGTAAEALQAVNAHGIHPSDRPVGPFVIAPFKNTPDYFVSEFFVKDECEPSVSRWYDNDRQAFGVTVIAPWPAGTLLHYDKGR